MSKVRLSSNYDWIRDEAWFQAMPVEHRMRVLRERDRDRQRGQAAEAAQKSGRRQVVLQAAVLFLAFQVSLTGFSVTSLILAPLVGSIVGGLWVSANAGILLSPLIAMPAYLCMQFVPASGQLHGLILLVAAFPLGLLSAYLGSRRELSTYE